MCYNKNVNAIYGCDEREVWTSKCPKASVAAEALVCGLKIPNNVGTTGEPDTGVEISTISEL